jgi:hypothetical protein
MALSTSRAEVGSGSSVRSLSSASSSSNWLIAAAVGDELADDER